MPASVPLADPLAAQATAPCLAALGRPDLSVSLKLAQGMGLRTDDVRVAVSEATTGSQ